MSTVSVSSNDCFARFFRGQERWICHLLSLLSTFFSNFLHRVSLLSFYPSDSPRQHSGLFFCALIPYTSLITPSFVLSHRQPSDWLERSLMWRTMTHTLRPIWELMSANISKLKHCVKSSENFQCWLKALAYTEPSAAEKILCAAELPDRSASNCQIRALEVCTVGGSVSLCAALPCGGVEWEECYELKIDPSTAIVFEAFCATRIWFGRADISLGRAPQNSGTKLCFPIRWWKNPRPWSHWIT
jgi:hypothetical protein